MRILRSEILDHLEQLADGAREVIERHDHKGVADVDLPKQFSSARVVFPTCRGPKGYRWIAVEELDKLGCFPAFLGKRVLLPQATT